MRFALLCNPVSGNGRARRLTPIIETLLKRNGHRVEVYWTRKRGDATEWARVRGGKQDRVLVIGGDGTLNELVNGLEEPFRTPIAQLATGTANLLAHDLALPRDPQAVARMLETGNTLSVDLGLVGERRFLLVLSAGFDAMVTRDIEQSRGSTLGYLGYARPVLRVLRSYRAPRMQVEVDGGPAVSGELVIVSNTRNYGGLFTMADRARCDSGHLDICVLANASLSGLIRAGMAGLSSGLSRRDDVIYRIGRRVRVRAEEAVPYEVDGDHVGTLPVEVELRPGAIPIVVP